LVVDKPAQTTKRHAAGRQRNAHVRRRSSHNSITSASCLVSRQAADLDGDGNVTDGELRNKYGNKTSAQRAQVRLITSGSGGADKSGVANQRFV
jgi:hypothetical protein